MLIPLNIFFMKFINWERKGKRDIAIRFIDTG